MTSDDARTIARKFIEMLAREHPAQAAEVGSILLMEILAIGLHSVDDPEAVGEFVRAVNAKLVEIAAAGGSRRVWRLIAIDPPEGP